MYFSFRHFLRQKSTLVFTNDHFLIANVKRLVFYFKFQIFFDIIKNLIFKAKKKNQNQNFDGLRKMLYAG